MHAKPRVGPIRWIWPTVALSAGAFACGRHTETAQVPAISVTLDSVTWISPPADEQLWGIRDVLEIEGTTWALTSSKPLLHGFRDGARFAAIGMIGPGPLEMLSPKALLHGPEPGAVTVWDPGAERYVTYSGSDASLTTRAAPRNGGLVRPDIAAVTFGDPFRMGSVIGYAFGVRYGDRVLRGEDLWGGRLYRMRVSRRQSASNGRLGPCSRPKSRSVSISSVDRAMHGSRSSMAEFIRSAMALCGEQFHSMTRRMSPPK